MTLAHHRRPVPVPVAREPVPVPLAIDGGTAAGDLMGFNHLTDPGEHLALGLGPWRQRVTQQAAGGEVPVRVHSECLTGEVFGSQRCDCGPQLHESLARLAQDGGVLIYLRQEGRGIGLYAKLDSYTLQDQGLDTFEANTALGFPADARRYAVAAQMLGALGIHRIALHTNNPDKVRQLLEQGLEVSRVVPTCTHVTDANRAYLQAKTAYAGHRLDVGPDHELNAVPHRRSS
jgi:GTP cyclohydrolase II